MEKIKFVPLTYGNNAKVYVKGDTIVRMYEDGGNTYVNTINSDTPMIVKESVNEILVKIGVEIEERKAGEWVDTHHEEEYFSKEYKCSLCGEVTIDNGLYCPHCGAEMENGEKND